MTRPPDEIFANPRLAPLYDVFDSDRSDLDLYSAIADEFEAESILDVGCGTGTLACLLARRGKVVVGVDPAEASLTVARSKPHADRVRWIHGDASALPPMQADLATMTANVAQVFVDDDAWLETLRGIYRATAPHARLVFETRDPARRAWEAWTRETTRSRHDVAGVGVVESWVDVGEVSLPLVSFTHTYRFESDGVILTSNSTLRFRSRDEIEESLNETGWTVAEVRDAPDRPGREWVFVATKLDARAGE